MGVLPSGEEQSKGEREHCPLERGMSPAPKASLIGGVRRQEMRGLNPSAVHFWTEIPPFWEEDECHCGAGGVLELGREFNQEHSRHPVDPGHLLPHLSFGSV